MDQGFGISQSKFLKLFFPNFQPKNEENNQEYGRGNRVRKQVNYVDDMTDNQWLKMIEEAKEFTDIPVIIVP